MRTVLTLSLALLLAACAAPSSEPSATPAAKRAQAPAFVLLGELHDNPEHHRARAQRLRELLADGVPTVVVVEQLDRGQDLTPSAAEPLEQALARAGFDARAWRWPLHQPVFDAALQGGAPVRGGNLSREQARRIVRDGDAAWPAELLALRSRMDWRDTDEQALRDDILRGHCGMLPATILPGMVQAQRARDLSLAQALLQARAQGAARVVLIAGNGHVRRDLAVPRALLALGVPPAQIDSVGYLEPGSDAPRGAYDQIERYPAPPREDPCAALGKR
ncbi:ChaN family lipoprotein [Pelomonas sp. CA6]|uniref:ChaN family lipoprotein n=1 Tax=Pelomonas sp. CA6 TaxID=2907999 RepID=UPI001F4BECF4|nr:ChaN family lipoprotein [Pelomonas sp. CA6]MCH7344465.1 ChaN family lipoprotein [Pelomonas sp. CA6]